MFPMHHKWVVSGGFVLELTFDFLASFISNFFTFLQQKKVFDVFDFLFNQKLRLLPDPALKFGKHNFGLFKDGFSTSIKLLFEQILTSSLLGNHQQSLSLQTQLTEHFKAGEFSLFCLISSGWTLIESGRLRLNKGAPK